MASRGQASDARGLARLLQPESALFETVSMNKGDQGK